MNVYDSALMTDMLQGIGYKIVDDVADADIVLLNTCNIREKAAEKMYSELGRINCITNSQSRKIITVVAGCVAQAEGEEIMRRANNVDIVVGPQTLHTLPEMIGKVERKMGKQSALNFEADTKFDYITEENLIKTGDVSAFISVQEGCDKFCTFCCVPYTRGAEYSRGVSKIYREAVRLVESGVKEITLLGQNVTAYHGEFDNGVKSSEIDLGNLLLILTNIRNLERIRYTTSHPRDMHDSLYNAHKHDKIMPFKHLPIQSGSDRVLQIMNRKHSTKEYLEVIKALRDVRPDIQFSSDFIVGFPGETDRDFEDTLKLVEQVKFAQAYSFKYSPRHGTPAASMKNQVDEKVKSMRLQRLQSILEEHKLSFNQSMIGKKVNVLFEKRTHKGSAQITGKTEYLQSLYMDISNDIPDVYGKVCEVEVTNAGPNSVNGKLINIC